jgi:integrase
LVKRVLIDGERVYRPAESQEEGVFYLSWYGERQGKVVRKREALRSDLTLKQALKERDEKQKDLDAIGRLKENGTYTEPEKATERLLLTDAVTEYLAEIKAHKSAKTLSAYAKALEYFQQSCTKTFVDSIDRKDLLAFKTYLEDEKNQSDRSVWNKFSAVMGFLKSVNRTGKDMGVVKHDWPEYDEETPDVYKDSELEKFYAACDEEETRWFRFFELTGMREGEVQHCQWSWIDLDERTITVQPNKRHDWRPKKNKTRHIPMSGALYELLKDWRKQTADSACDLVFPTSGCKVKLDFLDCLKAVAKRAGLFCGKCAGCANESQNCENWFLHKFRSTFGTKVLRKTDVRTAMEWLGHTDMESTMRYLRPAEGKDAQKKMDAVFG